MMVRRALTALAAVPCLAAPAMAQRLSYDLSDAGRSGRAIVSEPVSAPQADLASPQLASPEPDRLVRDGLIGGVSLNNNLRIGIGRFSVPPIARPRTNMERQREPTSVRTRDRGILALGMRLSF